VIQTRILAAGVAMVVCLPLMAVVPAAARSAGKPKAPTASVTMDYTVRRSVTGGAAKEDWEEFTIKMKGDGLTLRPGDYYPGRGWMGYFRGKVKVEVTYKAHYLDDNTSIFIGCETEQLDKAGSWSGKRSIAIRPVDEIYDNVTGKTRRFRGWAVDFPGNWRMKVAITGTMQRYENLVAQKNCLTIPWGTTGEYAWGDGKQSMEYGWEGTGFIDGPGSAYGHPNPDLRGGLLTEVDHPWTDETDFGGTTTTTTKTINGFFTFTDPVIDHTGNSSSGY
jgi:hypothetical protein